MNIWICLWKNLSFVYLFYLFFYGPLSTPWLPVIYVGKWKNIVNVYERKLHDTNATWLIFCCFQWGHMSGNEASCMKDKRAWGSSRVCCLWVCVVIHIFYASSCRRVHRALSVDKIWLYGEAEHAFSLIFLIQIFYITFIKVILFTPAI